MRKVKLSPIFLLTVVFLLILFTVACSADEPEPTSTPLPEEMPVVETPGSELTIPAEDEGSQDEATEEEGAEPGATAEIEVEGSQTPPASGLTAVIVSGDFAGAGKPFTFDGTQSQAGEAPIVNYVWNMGDGTTLFGLAIEHAYSEPGFYTVSLTVTTEDGQTDTTSKEVEIKLLEDLLKPTAVIEFTLVDTGWVMNNAMRGTTVTLIFAEDSLSGSSGCNSYSADYSITSWEDNTTDISVGFVSSSGQVCTQEIMAQERGYLDSLGSANHVTLDGTTLILDTGSGTLSFRVFEVTE